MEWLAANAVNLFLSVIMICGGIVFGLNLDKRLTSIEREQAEIKAVIVVSARLEERLTYIYQIVLAQGKRLDRIAERIYARKALQEEDDSSG